MPAGVYTLAGSRSGQAPLLIWYAVNTLGLDGLRARARESWQVAAYAVERLQGIGWNAWRHPHAMTVTLDSPPAEVAARWRLASSNGHSHIITVPGVTTEQLDVLASELAVHVPPRHGPHTAEWPTVPAPTHPHVRRGGRQMIATDITIELGRLCNPSATTTGPRHQLLRLRDRPLVVMPYARCRGGWECVIGASRVLRDVHHITLTDEQVAEAATTIPVQPDCDPDGYARPRLDVAGVSGTGPEWRPSPWPGTSWTDCARPTVLVSRPRRWPTTPRSRAGYPPRGPSRRQVARPAHHRRLPHSRHAADVAADAARLRPGLRSGLPVGSSRSVAAMHRQMAPKSAASGTEDQVT